MESICTAIAVGGDVDTTAAMTGAMSGALVGLDRLPRQNLVRFLSDPEVEFTQFRRIEPQWALIRFVG
jgi:ADP-ribosylglycohydrolase